MESFAVGEPSTLSNTLLEVEPSQGRAMTSLQIGRDGRPGVQRLAS